MSSAIDSIYAPTLRMKSGELQGLERLFEDIKPRVLPHLVVPPRTERDQDLQKLLLDADSLPSVGTILAKHWRRKVLLNLKYLFDDFGESRCGLWLPKTFELALRERVEAIPVATTDDLLGSRLRPFRDALLASDGIKLALSIPSHQIADPNMGDHVKRALGNIDIGQAQCVILADFSDADFSNPEFVAGVVEASLEALDDIGRWHAIIFQGTSYPEKNPSGHGGEKLVPRNEWKAWTRAVRFDDKTPDHLVFGDYAADCARMLFGACSARAIRHYRYTTSTDWFVTRGAESGSDAVLMTDVCRRILESGHFAGPTFSFADDFIYRTAKGVGRPGNSTTWREVNTTHHITQVVRDIGRVKGMLFGAGAEPPRQFELFSGE